MGCKPSKDEVHLEIYNTLMNSKIERLEDEVAKLEQENQMLRLNISSLTRTQEDHTQGFISSMSGNLDSAASVLSTVNNAVEHGEQTRPRAILPKHTAVGIAVDRSAPSPRGAPNDSPMGFEHEKQPSLRLGLKSVNKSQAMSQYSEFSSGPGMTKPSPRLRPIMQSKKDMLPEYSNDHLEVPRVESEAKPLEDGF